MGHFFIWDIALLKISLFCTYVWLTFWLDIGFLVGNNFIRISLKLLHCCLVSTVSVKILLFISSVLKFHDEAKSWPRCSFVFIQCTVSVWKLMSFHSLFFNTTVHITKFTLLKCIIRWFLVYSQSLGTITAT